MNAIFSYFRTEELLLLATVLLFFAIELYYWVHVFGRVAWQKTQRQPTNDTKKPVSIILSARNEQQMLQKNLPAILAQDYPEFEVIVVNDCSEDDSETLLASMQANYPNLVFRTIVKDEKFRHNKKMALGVGIKAARYDLLLFIDADCYPSSNQWLQSMQRYFTDKKEIIVGYTRLTNTAKWIRADHFMQGLHFLGRALLKKAYMGNNSNLAYRRRLFFDNKGFDVRVIGNLREDLVFINKVATRTNTAVALGPESTTISTLHYSTTDWHRHRIEELRSMALSEHGPRYPALGEATCRLLFFASVVAAAILFIDHYIVLCSLGGALLIRLTCQTLLYIYAQKRLGESGLTPMLWLWDLVFPFYYYYLIIATKLKKTAPWR